MSETPEPSPAAPRTRNGGLILAIAFVAAAAIGAAGFYAWSTSGGNTAQVAGTCAVDESFAAKLDAAAIGDVAAFKPVERAFDASALAFNDETGTPTTLASRAGKTVLLNLWATWCAPCRAEMPALETLNETMGGDNFEVLPVSLDLGTDAKPKKFYADMKLDGLPFAHDGQMGALTTFREQGLALGLPATFLIDPTGCVLGVLNGPAEWASPSAQRLVQTALNG